MSTTGARSTSMPSSFIALAWWAAIAVTCSGVMVAACSRAGGSLPSSDESRWTRPPSSSVAIRGLMSPGAAARIAASPSARSSPGVPRKMIPPTCSSRTRPTPWSTWSNVSSAITSCATFWRVVRPAVGEAQAVGGAALVVGVVAAVPGVVAAAVVVGDAAAVVVDGRLGVLLVPARASDDDPHPAAATRPSTARTTASRGARLAVGEPMALLSIRRPAPERGQPAGSGARGDAPHEALVEVLEGLLELGPGVHDERPVLGHRLPDRAAAEQQHVEAGVAIVL